MEIIRLSGYNIYLGDFWEELARFLEEGRYSRIMIIVDENSKRECLPVFRGQLQDPDLLVIEVRAGEQHKNIESCRQIWRQMMEGGADRHSLAVNLGGGVIGDMGGFCACTFKRGLDFIQVPTTLLSQVDASIGGKLGIDFLQVKNCIGLFADPKGVFIDPVFLKTLSVREIRSGFAEIVKHSLIAEAGQWSELRQVGDLEQMDWERFLLPSLLIKKRIVEEDPFEKGLRKALNFGHTVGHAIEGQALHSEEPLLHGEAIAIGMICEAYLSHRRLDLPAGELEAIVDFLMQKYGPTALDPVIFDDLLELMFNDKKNEGGQINFTLINPTGRAVIDQFCDKKEIFESFSFYNRLAGN